MFLTMNAICDWAGSNPSQRNFVEGERVLNAGHVIKCGIISAKSVSDMTEIQAFVLQTSNLRDNPHEIKGTISKDKSINNMKCTCKAGLSAKCKHIMATLLYCYRLVFTQFFSLK